MNGISEIIKYEGDNTTFVWKHPCEDFNTTTQLIVHESQEALFFMNGQALDLFGPGRHTLETQNIPLIKKWLNKPTDDRTPFHCEVYFINKVDQMAILWGTTSKVQYVEPTYKFPLSIGASGEMALSVDDSRRLIVKLVGTERVLSQQQIVNFFRSFLMTRIKTYIAQTIKKNAINIFEIDEQLEIFSEEIRSRLIEDFLAYGVVLKRFFVTTIVKPDGDAQYEKFKELHFRQYADVTEAQLLQKVGIIEQQTVAQRMVIESQGLAQKRATEGYTYQQERGFDVAEKVAQNEGVGNFSNAGIGIGMMAGIGGPVGGAVGGVFNDSISKIADPISSSQGKSGKRFCEDCGSENDGSAMFCANCGKSLSSESGELCKNCGLKFERPGKFCPRCGTRRE